ncbi:hypothetical protein OUZ56_029231 [Daphnia magna]|uniref:peptidyl-tRNA hydrolase n=1 Tax=Daphnia magna TaxID=35525 RepID=A0ABR0B673_9CRUS|nr:hypothetical protein OUZ56_029231 [Daphnia magna]
MSTKLPNTGFATTGVIWQILALIQDIGQQIQIQKNVGIFNSHILIKMLFYFVLVISDETPGKACLVSMTKETDIEEADPVIAKLQKTGCLEKHYAVLLRSAIHNRVLVHLNQPIKMVIVVRNNLGMGKGKIASQCAHAAVQCYKTALRMDNRTLKIWLASGQPKVVVKVDTEEELLSISALSSKIGLINCLIRDAGKTQLEPSTTTVLGIGPGKKQDIDSVTGHLKLL